MTILLITAGGILALVLLFVFWQVVGTGPRRSRRLRLAQKILADGNWQEALQTLEPFRHQQYSARWEKKINAVQSSCRNAAAQQLLANKNYEEALETWQHAAELVGNDPAQFKRVVINAMLDEVRRLFLLTKDSDVKPVQDLIARILIIEPACTEASFWHGLCFIREKNEALAVDVFKRIVEAETPDTIDALTPQASVKQIDPPLYLGALLLRQGQPREALRYLTEANRIDSNCPAVICQLGTAMIEGGGDTQFAIRTLQRALGPKGLEQWREKPERIWIQGFPPQSYVHIAASEYGYRCPLWGGDAAVLRREANTALADGHYRLGEYEQAAKIYDWLVHQSAPSPKVLRGLGLALVQLERYDEAFKHLRTVHELENPKTHLTAGYLALCGAKGKPASPEDKINNVVWSLWLVRGFEAHGDLEWIGLLNRIFEEARSSGASIEVEDQLHLCEHLASIHATDPMAAHGYLHLAVTHPEALRSEFAWLYCRAAHAHDLHDELSVDLFARTFREREQAAAYYTSQGWDFDELEYTFLAQAAEQQPGRFPEVLGEDYAQRGERLLIEKCTQFQDRGFHDAAIRAIDMLVRLSPGNASAYDLSARLHYKNGHPERATELLQDWHAQDPTTPIPLVRLAVLHQQQAADTASQECIRKALECSSGTEKANIAFLGVRLVLASSLHSDDAQPVAFSTSSLEECSRLLQECLQANPSHHDAKWTLAAVRCLLNDQAGLAEMATAMNASDNGDPRYNLLAAICQLAAGNHEGVDRMTETLSSDPVLKSEAEYLLGWSDAEQQLAEQAAGHFAHVAQTNGPSAPYAGAVLGGIHYFQKSYESAVADWKALDAEVRKKWNLEQPLAYAVFLCALRAFHNQEYQVAAAKLREAGRLGVRDKRIGPLLSLSLLNAGKQILYHP